MNVPNESRIPLEIAEAALALIKPFTGLETVSELNAAIANKMQDSVMLNQKEAEQYCKLSYWTLRRAEQRGKLSVCRASRKRLYKKTDLEKYLMGE